MKTEKITHTELVEEAVGWLKTQAYGTNEHKCPRGGRCSIILSEIVTRASDIPDAIGWREGHSVLIECKTSRSDFKMDQLKSQRQNGTGMGEQRYYFAPVGLLKESDLPPQWGLIEFFPGTRVGPSRCIVPCASRILDDRANLDEKLLLLSAIRRMKHRSFLIVQPQPNEEITQVTVDG